MIVNMHYAKTHFSRLVSRATSGEEVIIAKNGKPLLKLTPVQGAEGMRTPGLSKGAATVSEDFADPLPEEVAREFEK